VYDGGIRVPFFVRWPNQLKPGRFEKPAAHIDVTPTLAAACGVAPSPQLKIDGRNLLPHLTGRSKDWSDRTLFFQWHRGDEPQVGRAFAARGPRWKLVQAAGTGPQAQERQWKNELFDMESDPFELKDVAAEHPQVVADLRKQYEEWFRDVAATRKFAPPRIHLGTKHENPVILTRQDWRGPRAGWALDDLGYWEVHVAETKKYTVRLKFAPRVDAGSAVLRIGKLEKSVPIAARAVEAQFDNVDLPEGPGRLEAVIRIGQRDYGVKYVEVE
jgi:hypothetical protein